MSAHVISSESIPWSEQSHGDRYFIRRKQLGAAAGGQKLGCSLIEVPAGKSGWPFHFHLANEEAIYVLEGTATLRLGAGERTIRAGDYVALPSGEATAHQIINASEAPVRYLAFSTMIEPDITVYPDSKKVGLFAGAAPGGPKAQRTLNTYLPIDAAVDYWKDES